MRRLIARLTATSLPYRVVRQTGPGLDSEVCRHRFETVAELCAHRRDRREQESGVVYTALPAAMRS